MFYDIIQWGVTFLVTNIGISFEDRHSLLRQATEMYVLGEEEREVEGTNFEGRVYTRREYQLLGTLSGQRFDAELDTDKGKVKLAFLVNEKTEGFKFLKPYCVN